MEKTQTFMYSNEVDLEIHCSPFGLSGLYIKVRGTDIVGIGSTMGRITGSTTGTIHYNKSEDLIDTKYKLYVIIDDDGMLRIDFTKVFVNESSPASDTTTRDSVTSQSKDSVSSMSSMAPSIPSQRENSIQSQEPDEEEEELPSLIFRGMVPEGHPDKIEPFIGIFSFEREE